MHVVTIICIVGLALLMVALVVLFGFMLAARPTEVNQIADDPAFGQPRALAKTQAPAWTLGENPELDPNSPEARLIRMTDDELQGELQRVTQDLPAPPQEESDNRAQQILTAATRTYGEAGTENVGSGNGIVVCAGRFEYGTDALLLVRMLRKQGCQLPIEIWHRNDELSAAFVAAFEAERCTVRNVDAVSGVSFANPFAIKPLAVYHSAFQKVLLLDADNLPVKDPTYLFEMLNETQSTVFWPDHWPLDRKARCWKLLSDAQVAQMTYTNAQDSGQLLVDKSKCLKALAVCARVNVQLHSQLKRLFPEPFNHGDKDTWHFAWLSTSTPFTMMPGRPGGAGAKDHTGQYIGHTVVQYDLQSDPIFLHKMRAKWASQTMVPQWTDVVKFLNPTRGRVHPFTMRFEDGPITRLPFITAFHDLEEQCWATLRDIRALPWYASEFAAELKDLGKVSN